ncbi:hypothetical protein DPMN_087886 [Dreissena polymorpha]|uniref:Uncharacterized protein n=1 Tax=Dreissena polymorpha TaxID=45954 RepID=A0A9D4KTK6_DREPO|nr:hypothetical protein DPMN_087886 [Dreissena polymorpha]
MIALPTFLSRQLCLNFSSSMWNLSEDAPVLSSCDLLSLSAPLSNTAEAALRP